VGGEGEVMAGAGRAAVGGVGEGEEKAGAGDEGGEGGEEKAEPLPTLVVCGIPPSSGSSTAMT
jgi:hypothetical protein